MPIDALTTIAAVLAGIWLRMQQAKHELSPRHTAILGLAILALLAMCNRIIHSLANLASW